MPRTSEYTEHDIFTIADDLLTQGQTPTVKAIRERLGMGSYTKLTELLNRWKEKQRQVIEKQIPELPQSVELAFIRAWEAAWLEAEESFSQQRAEMQRQQQEVKTQLDDLMAEVEQLENSVSEAKRAEQAAQKKTSELLEKDQQSQLELATLNERLANAQQRQKDTDEHLNTLKESLHNERLARQKAEKELEVNSN